jgi:predicted phosphodiesterase
MPTLDWFEWGGRHVRMAHATPHGDLFEYLRVDQWEARVGALSEDFVFLGHAHWPGVRLFGKTTIVNPGSVGLARDGGGEACYAVLEEGRVTLKRVPYDVDRTVALLRAASLPLAVIEALERVLRAPRKLPSCGG